jgi:hypothetical protein
LFTSLPTAASALTVAPQPQAPLPQTPQATTHLQDAGVTHLNDLQAQAAAAVEAAAAAQAAVSAALAAGNTGAAASTGKASTVTA